MWRACSTPAPASNKFCIFTKVLHLSEVHRKSELSHLSEVRSRQSITSNNIYFSSVFIHIVAYYRSVLFVVALLRQRLQPTSTPRVCMFIFWAKQRLQRRSFYMPFSLPTYARTVFTSACTTKSEVMLFLKSSLQTNNLPHRTTSYIIRGR